MSSNEIASLINECKTIEENCLYTAAAHFIIENKMAAKARFYKYAPAIVAAIGGGAVLLGYDKAWGWVSIIGGLSTAMATALDVDKKTSEHKEAAKEFTILRHKARVAYQTFANEMKHEEFVQLTRDLCDRYADLVRRSPCTTEEAFEQGRKKVKAGDYKPDFLEVGEKEASLSKVPKNKGEGVPKE